MTSIAHDIIRDKQTEIQLKKLSEPSELINSTMGMDRVLYDLEYLSKDANSEEFKKHWGDKRKQLGE